MKLIKKILIINIVLVLGIFIFGNIKSNATDNGSFSVNKTYINVVKGNKKTFKITLKNGEGIFSVKSSDKSIVTVSESTTPWIDNNSYTITVTAKKRGTATITVSAKDVSGNNAKVVNGSKTIKVEVNNEYEPTISKITAGTKKATITWGKISGVKGYEIFMSTSKKGTYKKIKNIKKYTTTTYTKKSLKKGKKYYFKIRTYRIVKNKKKYSNYSRIKYVTVKK